MPSGLTLFNGWRLDHALVRAVILLVESVLVSATAMVQKRRALLQLLIIEELEQRRARGRLIRFGLVAREALIDLLRTGRIS